MSRSISRRLIVSKPCIPSSPSTWLCLRTHPFSTSSIRHADEQSRPSRDAAPTASTSTPSTPPNKTDEGLGGISALLRSNAAERKLKSATQSRFGFLDSAKTSSTGDGFEILGRKPAAHEEPHHFHIYAHKHNCHITLTRPDRSKIMSVSCGNIGFKKAGRKHYDSAFQLASYVLNRIREQGLHPQIKQLEVILRGFGAGREAVTKALLGTEGRLLRNKIVKVADATRLKFGGTRSSKPRRLG